MSEEFEVSVSLPLDSDDFLRRECPACERQFKWLHTNDGRNGTADQYFCPLCGEPSGPDSWWTPAQVEALTAAAIPDIEQTVHGVLEKTLRQSKYLSFTDRRSFSFDAGDPAPLIESNDMVIVEPPCHPQEPIKVPAESTGRVHCLLCGDPFTA